MDRKVLKAREGMMLTNGSDVGKEVYLGENDSADNWREVEETELPNFAEFI